MLVIRGEDGEIKTLFSKEGATQGDPLSMIIYGMGMLPLTHSLKRQIKDCLQPWYADDAAAGGKFDAIARYYNVLLAEGPGRGYYPEPTKSILVVKPQSVERARAQFAHLGFKVVTGTRYHRGYIGDEAACT